jgi:hypothetical protein
MQDKLNGATELPCVQITQLKAMIKSLHGTRDQYGRLAQKAEQSRIQQRNDGSSERDRCEMGQTMCTILIEAYEAALLATPSTQPNMIGANEEYLRGHSDAIKESVEERDWMTHKAWMDAVLMLVHYTENAKRTWLVGHQEAARQRDEWWDRCRALAATKSAQDIEASVAPQPSVGATGTQEFTLRAMAQNYSGGHSCDHLDGEACLKAADEIRSLRLELAATIREGISAVAEARQTPPPSTHVEVSGMTKSLKELVDLVAADTGALAATDADEDSVGWNGDGKPLPMTFGHVRRAAKELEEIAAHPQPHVVAYRLLSEGEIVQKGDQPLNDDCVSWGELVGWEIGIAYYHSVFVPIRRALATTEGKDNG